MKLKEFLFGKKEEKVNVPVQPALEMAWLSSNFAFRWVTRLKDWGMTIDEYTKEKKQKKTDEDTIFSLYKKLILKHRNDLLIQQALYYELAMMQAELGKDPKQNLIRAQSSALSYYQRCKSVRNAVIESNKDACPSCRKLDGWIMTFAQVKKLHPLPNTKCTKKHGKYAFCRCVYGSMNELE